ncbi:SWIM zinc finger family protein [Candidatus Magnetobacterium casensis]|uniref:SWIM zinc finger family protein n=1 Tax=Candidatus Magnetobacterium casense TaxID=1455061 RepID=A0ABS6S460_9BACT|nr:SWIM zinc finger family protein [Candidatus Magnetobacterium casensis]
MATDKWVNRWPVPRSDGKGNWIVAVDKDGNWGCSCPVWKFGRKECKHIGAIKSGEYDVPATAKAEYRLAKVLKPKYDAGTNTLLVPLIAIPDTRMMEATIVYYMLNHGYSMAEIRQMRHLPKEWTKDAVVDYVREHGEAEYPPDWYPKPESMSLARTAGRVGRKKRKPSTSLKGVR